MGVLADSFRRLADVFKNLTNDLSTMNNEININGDYEYRLDANKYKGSFKTVATNINDTITGNIEDLMEILRASVEIGEGRDGNI
jgi:hypothetical protein